ncbi:MAG: SURF1 family protein [Defluviicoccus sp.]|nr:SURF1 family protein [Defluviicoccus sp.]MDE0386694.1 SURF1 family protein [Defluviicoccus sp.]
MNTTAGRDRARRRFRPTLWATVAAGMAFAILVGLGTWQLHRLQWKEGVIAYREAQLAAEPVAIGEHTRDGADVAFRRARATGRFLHAREFLIVSRMRKGRAGFDVVTPLRLGDGDHILVNRGWVPLDRADPRTRRKGGIAGEATVTGVLRRPGKSSRWVPDNDPEKGVWYFVEPGQMGAVASLPGVREVFLVADATPNPGGFPAGRRIGVDIPNRHLEYALTWYGLALVLAAIYLLFHWRREEDDGRG